MDTDGSKEGWSSNHTGDDTEDTKGSSKNKSGTPSGEDGEDGEPSDLWLIGILSPLPVYTLYVVVEFFYPYSDVTPTLGLLAISVHIGGVVSLIIDVRRIGDPHYRDTDKIRIIGVIAAGSFPFHSYSPASDSLADSFFS